MSDLRNNWSVKTVCHHTNMSKSTLYRALVTYNISLKKLVLDLKINYAMDLLTDTDLSISEISYRSGFDNPSYFSNRFKMKKGVSPTSFRTMLKMK
ncbi:helix-turn-helix domain-containing protein [Vibrio renipiscarius]